jgi:hypothetical protein
VWAPRISKGNDIETKAEKASLLSSFSKVRSGANSVYSANLKDRSLFIPQIRKIEAERTLFIPQIGKIEAKRSLFIPQI